MKNLTLVEKMSLFFKCSVSDGSEDLAQQINTTAIDSVYRQAAQFLQVSEALQHAPGKLEEQCEHLQKLGAELKLSIDTLKRQTQGVLKDAKFSSGVK